MTVPRRHVARSGPAAGVCLEGCEPEGHGPNWSHWDYIVSASDPQRCELGDLFPLAWDHTVPCHDEQFLQSIAKKHKSPTDVPKLLLHRRWQGKQPCTAANARTGRVVFA